MKKNSKSLMKKEPRAKRAKAQRPVQREAKEVLAELVEKLRGKLELKSKLINVALAPACGRMHRNTIVPLVLRRTMAADKDCRLLLLTEYPEESCYLAVVGMGSSHPRCQLR